MSLLIDKEKCIKEYVSQRMTMIWQRREQVLQVTKKDGKIIIIFHKKIPKTLLWWW
jgi:hypothetical protein